MSFYIDIARRYGYAYTGERASTDNIAALHRTRKRAGAIVAIRRDGLIRVKRKVSLSSSARMLVFYEKVIASESKFDMTMQM